MRGKAEDAKRWDEEMRQANEARMQEEERWRGEDLWRLQKTAAEKLGVNLQKTPQKAETIAESAGDSKLTVAGGGGSTWYI